MSILGMSGTGEGEPKKGFDLTMAIELVLLVGKYAPAVVEAFQNFKGKNDRDPTAEEIRALVLDIKPPGEY